jgi:hypothetical protein
MQFILITKLIWNYIIPIEKGEKREKKLFLYDPAINIHIISYLLTQKKEKKGKNLFCFDCMILLLIYIIIIYNINDNELA